jgi:RHS repeat-associated protein
LFCISNGDGNFISPSNFYQSPLNLKDFAVADINGDGKIDTIAINSNGLAIKLNQTTTAYDGVGNIRFVTDAKYRTTEYKYDGNNRLTETKDALGYITQIAYDAVGNVIRTTDANNRTTEYKYDKDNRRTEIINALGNSSTTSYDAVGNVIATTDELGRITNYNYDNLNRQISVKDALNNSTNYSYDAVGNLIGMTDALGRTTNYNYDQLNRRTGITNALGNTRTTTYDAVGNVIASTDELGRTTTYNYDQLNRQTSVTDPLNHSTNYSYDAVGNLVGITDALGRTTSYGYDKLNRRISTTNALGNSSTTGYDAVGNVVASTDELGRITTFGYDSINRRITVTNPLGYTTTTQYDAVGNVVSLINPLGHTTKYIYDALDRQTGVIDASNQTTATTYDAVGNVLAIADPSGNKTSYTYDALDRLLTDTNQLGLTRSYTYDAVGNRISAIDRNGRKRIFSYDALDRQTVETWLDHSGNAINAISYSYDAASQLKTVTDINSSYTYTYDLAGRLIETDNIGTNGVPNVKLNYSYDAVNNLISAIDTINGQVKGATAYTYDGLDRTTRIIQTGNGVANKRIDMTYDAASQMIGLTRYSDLSGNQLVAQSNYTYDNNGRLIQLTHSKGANTLADYSWSYDAANRLTQTTSNDGTSNYNYDETDQLIGTDHSYQTDESYSYDANGNRTNSGYSTGSDNRLLTDGKYNYEYDSEGNRTKRIEIATGEVTQYSWDYRNRLTQVTVKDVNGNVIKKAEYTYDVYDRRITKSVDPDGDGAQTAQIERFVHDGDNIALVFDGNGNQTHRYLYGTEIDQIIADERANNQVIWSLSDNQGTVRDLVDNSGNVVNHIVYDSFGNITSQTHPNIDTRFTYTGRELDAETGLYYYRARYYDAAVGSFISVDPIGFEAGDSNLYRYVLNSPINYTDPSGQIIPLFVAGMVAMGVMNALIDINVQLAVNDMTDSYEMNWASVGVSFATGMVGFGLAQRATNAGSWAWKIASNPLAQRTFDSGIDGVGKIVENQINGKAWNNELLETVGGSFVLGSAADLGVKYGAKGLSVGAKNLDQFGGSALTWAKNPVSVEKYQLSSEGGFNWGLGVGVRVNPWDNHADPLSKQVFAAITGGDGFGGLSRSLDDYSYGAVPLDNTVGEVNSGLVGRQVELHPAYDLVDRVLEHRRLNKTSKYRNVAVFEFANQEGELVYKVFESKSIKIPGMKVRQGNKWVDQTYSQHSERVAEEYFSKHGIKPNQVKRVFTEFSPCFDRGNKCQSLFTGAGKYRNTQVFYSYQYTDDNMKEIARQSKFTDLAKYGLGFE